MRCDLKKKSSILKSLRTGLLIAISIIVFAYAFQVTNVNFETTRSEVRITQLTRVLRALAKPELVEYDTTEEEISSPFYLPCPDNGEIEGIEKNTNLAYIQTSVICASPKETITVEGFNMPANIKGPINFLAASGVKRQLANFETNSDGYFSVDVVVPTRQPVAEAQYITATIRTTTGLPKWTETAKATWDKIIETVFIALLATTIGTAASIPISFIAARNLMKDSTSTPTSTALNIIGFPLGAYLGYIFSKWIIDLLSPFEKNVFITLIGLIISGVIAYFSLRKGLPSEDIKKPTNSVKIQRFAFIFIAGVMAILSIILFGEFTKLAGEALENLLGPIGFLGYALFQIGDITSMLVPALTAIAFGGVIVSVFNKVGLSLQDNLNTSILKIINIVLSTIAGAILFALVMAVINWFYQFNNPRISLYYPVIIGGFAGFILAVIAKPKHLLPTGFIIYTITRTILNALRSIEPLVMAIIAVIWVGIGPFAGSLALALHTIAALAKLYSEQVESIDDGPLEAIHATGANKLQTIVYAVIPQIIPPYISFTMYRWDINVRMSTIIGFVGGGGIGFLLQQNINLLSYRSASVQMLAIAVVVASMDYVSSKIRERIV
jgi:phosphonate ABC transporter permease subunit PhnE